MYAKKGLAEMIFFDYIKSSTGDWYGQPLSVKFRKYFLNNHLLRIGGYFFIQKIMIAKKSTHKINVI